MASIARVTVDVASDGEVFTTMWGGVEGGEKILTGRLLIQCVVKTEDLKILEEDMKQSAGQIKAEGFSGQAKIERGEMVSPTEFLARETIHYIEI